MGNKKKETALQRQRRLAKEKQKRKLKKQNELFGARELRLCKQHEIDVKQQHEESPASRASRLEKQREINAKRRPEESPVSRASRLEKQREINAKRRHEESPVSRASRLEKQREIHAKRRHEESPASRASRLEKQREINAKRRHEESPVSRASRLEKQREINAKRRREDSLVSRATRLSIDRSAHEKRRREESPVSRATRLSIDRSAHEKRRRQINVTVEAFNVKKMSDVSMAPLNESEADTAIPDFSDNPVCSGDGKTCGECGKVFSHPFYFSTHISIHASEKGYSMAGQCVHCGLTFSDPAIFQEHLVSSQAKLKVENETEDEEMATTACLEYDNAEQDNERQKDTEARMSRKLPAVKPDLSRELVTVKQEILDPPDVSHEPKAKRRRTAIQRYEPETHADPDNDPAVEAYLMSLTQMGLTVDPAAFGHPSGRSRGKRGAQGRGRSRGHRQPFGRGATLVLPRNMDVPKKPSPKYEYLDYDNVLEDEGEILPKSGKQTRGERLQQRLQRLSQQKEPENQPAAAVSDSVSETKVSTETKVSSETKDEPKNELKTETKDEPERKMKLSPSSTPKPKSKAEKVSKPGSSGLSPFTTPGLDRSFALDKNMIRAEMEDRDYSPHSRHQGKGKRGSRGFRGHQRGTSLPALRPPPAPPQPPPPAPSIPGLTGYARANPNFRPPVVQTAARPPPSTKASKHGAIASQLKIKSPNAPMPTKSARMPSERSTERGSKTTRVGPAKEAFPKFLKVTSPKGIERSKQESRDYVEIMLQTLSDELIPNKLSKTFPTSTTFFGNSVDILTGTSVRMPHGRSAFPGTTRPARMSAPVRGSMFTDPFKGQVRHAGKAGFPDHSKGVNFNFNNGSRFPGSAPVRAPRSRGRAGASVGAARGRGQMTPAINRSGVLAQSLAYPVKIGRGVGRGEKNASRPPVQKPAQKPLICTDEVIVLEDDDEDGDSLTNKVKSGTGQKSTHPEKLTTVIVDIDKSDHLKSKTEVIQVLAEKTPDSPDLTSEQDKKLNLPASVCLERIDTSSPGSKTDPEGDKAELKDKEARSSKKEGEEMEVEDLDGWKVCLAANSDSESETEECPDGKKDLNAEVVKEGNLKPISESPRPDQEEKSVRVSDKEEKGEESSEDGKASDKKDASENSISSPVPSSSSAVPLTFPPFIKDTDNLLDIFSEIEKTCKEIEENSGNEKEDSGTESEGKESPSDTKARTVAADPPQEVSKMDEGATEEAASDDCKVGNALKLLGGDHDKSSEDSDEINSSRHDSSPDKVTAPGNKEQQESTEARDLDCDEKNHAGVLESDSCMAGANVKEPNDKSNDETVAGTKSDDVGEGIRDTDVEMNSGESDALIGSPTALKKDAADSNSDVGNASLAEQHIAEECGVDVKTQEVVTDFNSRPDAGSENLTTSNQCFPDRKILSDDSPVGQSGDEAMETDDGNITVAPSADTVGMDSSDPSEAFSEPVMNTESGPGELEAGKRLNSPPSEINKDNENLTDKEEDIDKSLESSIPFPASDKNNALVKFADSKNVSGNGPGVEASPNVEADKDPDLKAPSFCDIPFEAQQQDDKSIPCETDLESTELNRAPTLDDVRPNVALQDGAAENETGSEETFKKRSPGRTSCRDSELTPGHFDGEDDADRDGSDCHGSGANGSGSSRLNGVACTISGGKDGTTASAGGGNSQSVNVSDCDSLSTYGLSSASVEKSSMKCTETRNGKCLVKTGNWKRWARRTAPVMTKNASAIMSLCICPSQSLKISPSFFKKVFRLSLQKSSVRNQKSGRKIFNCPPRALSKRLSTPQLPKNHSLRSISDLVPGVWCTSGKGHPLNEHTVVYNVGCSGRFSDHQITSFIPGSRYVSKDDLMGKMVHNSNPHHKCRVMFCRQAECCPVWSFPFESVNHDTLQHPVSHCVKENSCVKMYYGNVSKIQCPQNVLPKMQKSCKLMYLKSGALARKLWLNKFISHHTTVHRGSQSGARSRGQHEQHRGRGHRGMSSIESGSTGRNRGNSSNGLAGDRSGSDGDQGDDGNRDERDKRLDIVKEGNFLKCSVCGIRFEFLKEWEKHMIRLHAGNEGSSERQNARLQPGFILPGCKEKPQSFCAERTDSFSKSIESSHFNSNTYENLTIWQTQVVLVKPNKPVVTLSSPGKTKKAARRPALALAESLKRTGRDRKKNDTKTSEVECNFRYEKEWNLDLSRKLRLKKHLTGKITKLTGISKANMFLNQCAVPVGGQEHVMACSNNSVLHPPVKSSVNSLALLAGSGAIKAELPSPDNPAGSSISVRAEPELFGSVAVKTEPCSDHSGSPPIKEEPLSDREDDFLTVTFEDSRLFKIESPEASVSKPPADSSTDRGSDQETAKTNCNDSNTIPKPELDNYESLTDGRRVMGDLDSTSIKLRSPKKPTQKEQETNTEIVFVYPNKPVINASPRSHSQLRCPDVMPGSREPQEDERKKMGNMDSSSVIHSSPKKTTQKDQETKTEIVFVYPQKPVINASPRSHSQLRCLDVMLDSREPQKDEIKGMGDMDSSSVIHNSPKKTAPKDQETKTEIVFVYPDKPVINALPRSHSDRTRSTARKKSVRPPTTSCSKNDDPQQVLNQGGNGEWSTSALQAEHKCRQTLRIDTTFSLREPGSVPGQKNEPQTLKPTLVYVHPKQPVVNLSGRASRPSPSRARLGPLRKAKPVKCS